MENVRRSFLIRHPIHLYDCWEVTSKDGSQALVTFIQVLGEVNKKAAVSF